MLVEIRQIGGRPPFLVLLPSQEELGVIEAVLGNKVVDDDGLIALVAGKYKLADGYGPAYIVLGVLETDSEGLEIHK